MLCWRRGFESGADECAAVRNLLRVGRAFLELSDDPPLPVLWLVPVVYSLDSYSQRIRVWQAKGSILVQVNPSAGKTTVRSVLMAFADLSLMTLAAIQKVDACGTRTITFEELKQACCRLPA